MKYVKILGLLAVAAAALMAIAGPASATQITSPTGTLYTGEIKSESVENAVAGTKHVLLHNPIANIKCNSTVHGSIESHGTDVTAKGKISTLDFTNCTDGWHVTAIQNADKSYGSLEVHWTSGYDGILTSSASKVAATRFGITCTYQTNNTSIGTVTGGKPAFFDIKATIPIVAAESSGLCFGIPAEWTGKYQVTSPTSLYLDHK